MASTSPKKKSDLVAIHDDANSDLVSGGGCIEACIFVIDENIRIRVVKLGEI